MFSGNILRDAIISGSNYIFNERQRVDELNVFPVPDGDTGTNMSMSIGNAARELSKQSGKNAGEIAKIAASAARSPTMPATAKTTTSQLILAHATVASSPTTSSV